MTNIIKFPGGYGVDINLIPKLNKQTGLTTFSEVLTIPNYDIESGLYLESERAVIKETSLPVKVDIHPGCYSLETLAQGLEIAILVTNDADVIRLLLKKINTCVLQRQISIDFTLEETKLCLDYIDCLQSPQWKENRRKLGVAKYS